MKWSDQPTKLGSGETSTARVDIDASLVRTLVASQFPQWGYLPIKPVALSGWDNKTFHLGEGMTVRLPSAARYSAQVEKEQRWLPRLAPLLPLPIPVPLAMGVPAHGYPWHWSVIGGSKVRTRPSNTSPTCANLRSRSQSSFSLCNGWIRQVDLRLDRITSIGVGRVEIYYEQTRQAIRDLAGTIDRDTVISVWDEALGARWRGRPVWLHGDVSEEIGWL